MENLPQDPFLLLSWVNTKLRDEYPSLQQLADDLGIDATVLEAKLHDAGFDYMQSINQFR